MRTTLRSPVARVILVVLAIALAEVVLMAYVPSRYRVFMLGLLAASVLACCGWLTLVVRRSHRTGLDRLGREATAQAVAGARRRRMGWRCINDLSLRGHGEINHILIGPGGVWVIESRWASKPCRIEHAAIVRLGGKEPVSWARAGAQRVERMLGASSDQIDVVVQPLVIVWGPGGLRLDAGWTEVEGVLVCEGRQQDRWLGRLDGPELSQVTVELIAEKLAGQDLHLVDRAAIAPG